MVEGKPDIVSTIEAEGIRLKRNMGLCPFHTEKHPSFRVNPQKQTFKCFGCGEGGDVIDFVQKLHNLSFNDACRHLSMTPGAKPEIDKEAERQRRLKKAYKRKCHEVYMGLCAESVRLHEMRVSVQADPGNLSEVKSILYALEMGNLSEVDYKLDVLMFGSDEDKFELIKGEINVR